MTKHRFNIATFRGKGNWTAFKKGKMITIEQQNKIKEILSPFQPKEIGIFGSYARGDNRENSDLDILVVFGKRLNLLDLVGLELELSEAIGIKVDLVTKKSLSPLVKSFVEEDLQKISVTTQVLE